MANVPYDQGVPFQQVSPTPPGDYLHAQPNPAQFGGQIAQGLQQEGQGVVTAVKMRSEHRSVSLLILNL